MSSLFLALGLLAVLALSFAGLRAYFGQRAFSQWLDLFASFTGEPAKLSQDAAAATARQRADLDRRFAALVAARAPLRAWLQLREADQDNFLTDRIDAVLRSRTDLDAALQHLLESPLRLDRGLALRHLGLAETTSDRTAHAALEAVELVATELRDERPRAGAQPEQLPALLFGAAQACDTLRERGHFVETAARDLRLAVATLGGGNQLEHVVATLDHALAP